MSHSLQDECHICFKLTGWVGKMMGDKHRCTCPDPETEIIEREWGGHGPQLTEGLTDIEHLGPGRIAA